MKRFLLRTAVRIKFACTTPGAASNQARNEMNRTIAAAQSVAPAMAAQRIRVPPMPGVDPDMRDWSLFMILAHNTVVNREVTGLVKCLATRQAFVSTFNMKTDVMPPLDAGAEQIEAFRRSVVDHLTVISTLPPLRNTRTHRHPIFDQLDAHGWHCMFAFHLMLHRRQAAAAAKELGQREK